MRKKSMNAMNRRDAELWLVNKTDNGSGLNVITRCISDAESIPNVGSRKTTHSWPVICRQSKYYTSNEDDEDDDDDEVDYETIFALDESYQNKSSTTTNTDNLSFRKYLVAGYGSKQKFASTSNTKNDCSVSSIVGLKGSSNTNRILSRNSIVPLMTKSQTQHNRTINNGTNNTVPADQTSCTAPPPIFYLFVTLLMTLAATALLCLAVMWVFLFYIW